MAKRTDSKEEIKKVAGTTTDFLAQYAEEDQSLAGMDAYRVLPRFKLIQQMTDPALKEAHGEGSAIIRPGDALVAKKGEPFLFVPHLFFVEFLILSDRRDKESPTVIQRTFDETTEIAKKARDKDKRFEVYAGHEGRDAKSQWTKRYIESLRFPGLIYGDHALTGTPAVLSFEKGEFFQGQNFISAIKLRREKIKDPQSGEERVVKVPLWAQVWSLQSALRPDRGKGSWYGFDFKPAQTPVIDPAHSEEMHLSHITLKELQEKNRIRVDGDEKEEETDGAAAKETGKF